MEIEQSSLTLKVHEAFITKQQKIDEEEEEEQGKCVFATKFHTEKEEEAPTEVVLSREQLLDLRIIKSQ